MVARRNLANRLELGPLPLVNLRRGVRNFALFDARSCSRRIASSSLTTHSTNITGTPWRAANASASCRSAEALKVASRIAPRPSRSRLSASASIAS